jgi:hypothetical protein
VNGINQKVVSRARQAMRLMWLPCLRILSLSVCILLGSCCSLSCHAAKRQEPVGTGVLEGLR